MHYELRSVILHGGSMALLMKTIGMVVVILLIMHALKKFSQELTSKMMAAVSGFTTLVTVPHSNSAARCMEGDPQVA